MNIVFDENKLKEARPRNMSLVKTVQALKETWGVELNKNTLCKYENGNLQPRVELYWLLCRLYDIPLEHCFKELPNISNK